MEMGRPSYGYKVAISPELKVSRSLIKETGVFCKSTKCHVIHCKEKPFTVNANYGLGRAES